MMDHEAAQIAQKHTNQLEARSLPDPEIISPTTIKKKGQRKVKTATRGHK